MAKKHPLSIVRLFEGLSDKQLAAIEAVGEYRDYVDGDTIFSEGDAGSHMYAVLEGRVQLEVALGNTAEQVPVHVSATGSVFGEFVLFEDEPRSASARALKSVHAFAATAEDLEKVFGVESAAGYKVMKNLCRIQVDRMRKTTSELRASLIW